jgi:phosphohistidine phosphatase SixA
LTVAILLRFRQSKIAAVCKIHYRGNEMNHLFSSIRLTSTLLLFQLLIAVLLVFPAQTSFAGNKANPATPDDKFKVITVFLARHAEKETAPPEDPPLTTAGQERAQTLMRTLANAGIKTIYTSQFLRTKQTAEPLAKQLGIDVTALTIKMDDKNPRKVSDQSYDEVVNKVYERAGESVLIVGHSNTLSEIIKRLGGDMMPSVDDKEFDDLFVVTIYEKGKAKVLRLKYGNKSNV